VGPALPLSRFGALQHRPRRRRAEPGRTTAVQRRREGVDADLPRHATRRGTGRRTTTTTSSRWCSRRCCPSHTAGLARRFASHLHLVIFSFQFGSLSVHLYPKPHHRVSCGLWQLSWRAGAVWRNAAPRAGTAGSWNAIRLRLIARRAPSRSDVPLRWDELSPSSPQGRDTGINACLLRGCLGLLDAQELHARIAKRGFYFNVILGIFSLA
jgi:hypothetical protein